MMDDKRGHTARSGQYGPSPLPYVNDLTLTDSQPDDSEPPRGSPPLDAVGRAMSGVVVAIAPAPAHPTTPERRHEAAQVPVAWVDTNAVAFNAQVQDVEPSQVGSSSQRGEVLARLGATFGELPPRQYAFIGTSPESSGSRRRPSNAEGSQRDGEYGAATSRRSPGSQRFREESSPGNSPAAKRRREN